jgi:hypothetical protein
VRVTLGVQIEDPAPALKKLRDRHDLAAMADLPWAVQAAQAVSNPLPCRSHCLWHISAGVCIGQRVLGQAENRSA